MGHRGGQDLSMKVVMGWVIGLSGIALMLLIMLILFGNLSGNVGFGDDTSTITITNESANSGSLAFANATGYTLAEVNSSNSAYAITDVFNVQGGLYNVSVPLANVSVTSAGVLTNATVTDYANVSVSYTFTFSFPSTGKANTDNFIGNYTTSVLNTGAQFPVVGTIIGVALLLFILISLLIFALVRMGKVGGSGNFG